MLSNNGGINEKQSRPHHILTFFTMSILISWSFGVLLQPAAGTLTSKECEECRDGWIFWIGYPLFVRKILLISPVVLNIHLDAAFLKLRINASISMLHGDLMHAGIWKNSREVPEARHKVKAMITAHAFILPFKWEETLWERNSWAHWTLMVNL